MTCQRCHQPCSGSTGSYFDTAQICFRCDEIERSHPAFEAARQKENEEVIRGNFNFRGVGVPHDLVGLCLAAAAEKEVA